MSLGANAHPHHSYDVVFGRGDQGESGVKRPETNGQVDVDPAVVKSMAEFLTKPFIQSFGASQDEGLIPAD